MSKSVKRISRPAAWALMGALAVALYGTCVTGGEMTTAQQLCCAAMGDCGRHAAEMSCCSVEQADQSTAAVKSSTPSIPEPGVAVRLDAFADVVHPRLTAHYFGRFTPQPPGIPKYLLVSVLLI